jgi:hypothetical protein
MDTPTLQFTIDTVALHGGNIAAAARTMGIARSTVSSRANRAADQGLKPTVESPDIDIQHAAEKVALEQEIGALKLQLKDALRERVDHDKLRGYAFDLGNYEAKPPAWIDDIPGEGQPGCPILHISDIHAGEKVNPVEVAGLNRYDFATMGKRLNRLAHNASKFCHTHIAKPDFPGIVVCLGGDMVNGDIHSEFRSTNEEPVLPTVLHIFEHLIATLDHLAESFGRVAVFTAFGNHGRNTEKPQYKMAAYTNFDWMLYNMLAKHYENQSTHDVKIVISDSFDNFFRVYGHGYLLTHGDRLGTGGGDGIVGVIGPIIRGSKKVKAAYAKMDIQVDTMIMGHYHQRIPLKGIRVNGSVKGYDEYAMGRRFDPEPPEQDLWLMHPKHGITMSIPIFLEETDQLHNDYSWISWPAQNM